MRTALVHDPLCLEHDSGPGHPERPARVAAILDALSDLPLIRLQARDARREELLRVHTASYLDALEERILSGASRLDADTAVGPSSFRAALRAAGAALALGDALCSGEIEAGFACVRPPGHHACPGRAMGFCLLNNAAILARSLAARNSRVAIVDWDVHHGNGTQDTFWDDPTVLYASLHQRPLYPGSGAASEKGAGNIVNVPLPPGTGPAKYLEAFDDFVGPALKRFGPDVVVVSCGFDAHARDPLAELSLASETYRTLTGRLIGYPVLSILEGGYDLQALAASARAHLEELLALPAPPSRSPRQS